MLLVILIIVAFIVTIVTIEYNATISCVIEQKESVGNIYLDDKDIETEDKLELLERSTGKIFTTLEYNETVQIKLDNTSIVFFEDYDIFKNTTYKLKKCVVYPINKETILDIINYNGENILIYVH